jgi:hypothetical protein
MENSVTNGELIPENNEVDDLINDISHFDNIHHLRSGIPFSMRDRWMLAGMTQTGKTTVARELVKKYLTSYDGLRVMIFDPKDVGDYNKLNSYCDVTHIRGGFPPDVIRVPGIQIWHPINATWDNIRKWLANINDDRDALLTVIDEPQRMAKGLTTSTWPQEFVILNKEGAGQLHALITLVQEIAGGARQIPAQATHAIQFRLENDYDNRILSRKFYRARRDGHITTLEPEHWHGFYHSRVDMLDRAREYSSYRTFI